MPDVFEERRHLSNVGCLEIKELIHLDGVNRRAWLTWIFLFDELAQSSHFQQIEVLELSPPCAEGARDDVACE